jgi:hypothetical protein
MVSVSLPVSVISGTQLSCDIIGLSGVLIFFVIFHFRPFQVLAIFTSVPEACINKTGLVLLFGIAVTYNLAYCPECHNNMCPDSYLVLQSWALICIFLSFFLHLNIFRWICDLFCWFLNILCTFFVFFSIFFVFYSLLWSFYDLFWCWIWIRQFFIQNLRCNYVVITIFILFYDFFTIFFDVGSE